MRKIIADLQTSLDGFIEGPNENLIGRWLKIKRRGVA